MAFWATFAPAWAASPAFAPAAADPFDDAPRACARAENSHLGFFGDLPRTHQENPLQVAKPHKEADATGWKTVSAGIVGSNSDPASLHKYLYGVNNPVSFLDPSGHFSLTELAISSSIIGTLSGITGSTISAIYSGGNARETWKGFVGGFYSGFLTTGLTPFVGPLTAAGIANGASTWAVEVSFSNGQINYTVVNLKAVLAVASGLAGQAFNLNVAGGQFDTNLEILVGQFMFSAEGQMRMTALKVLGEELAKQSIPAGVLGVASKVPDVFIDLVVSLKQYLESNKVPLTTANE